MSIGFKHALKKCRKVFGGYVRLDFHRYNSLMGVENWWKISDGFNTPMDNSSNDWILAEAKTFESALKRAKKKGKSDARKKHGF